MFFFKPKQALQPELLELLRIPLNFGCSAAAACWIKQIDKE
jgi:hypothetical protein